MSEEMKKESIPETEEAVNDAAEKKSRRSKKSEKKLDAEALLKELEELKAENEKLREDFDKLKDTHLRTLAEYDNYRKRTTKEKEAIYGDSKANTLKVLLPVLDNFDRARQNTTEDTEGYIKGVEMTLNQLSVVLEGLEVESFGQVGDEFDPNLHNAIMTVENADLPENSIAAVFEKGYRIGDRILRFATVQVTN